MSNWYKSYQKMYKNYSICKILQKNSSIIKHGKINANAQMFLNYEHSKQNYTALSYIHNEDLFFTSLCSSKLILLMFFSSTGFSKNVVSTICRFLSKYYIWGVSRIPAKICNGAFWNSTYYHKELHLRYWQRSRSGSALYY